MILKKEVNILEVFDLLDQYFPKGKCKERGEAMVLVAEIILLIRKKDE